MHLTVRFPLLTYLPRPPSSIIPVHTVPAASYHICLLKLLALLQINSMLSSSAFHHHIIILKEREGEVRRKKKLRPIWKNGKGAANERV